MREENKPNLENFISPRESLPGRILKFYQLTKFTKLQNTSSVLVLKAINFR
jgi:hypothetical protein